MKDQMVFVIEITMAVDAAGTLQTHLACSGEGFATRPTDTPANTAVPPTLIDPGSLRREMFSGDRVFGAVRPAFGEVVLYNGDGRYDSWEHHGFDGRDCVLRWGPVGGAYPADFAAVVICTVEGITLTETEARLRLRDNTVLLDKPFLKDTFTGLSPGEGSNIPSLKGNVKHRYIGATPWVGVPQLVSDHSGRTIFHVTTGDIGGNTELYDNGNQLGREATPAGEFWSYASFPSEGRFWAHSENGSSFIRTGSRPVGDLRVDMDATQVGGAAWDMQTLVTEAGYAGSFVGTQIPNINGIFADSGITYADIFDDAATYAGMWYGFDRLGRFTSKVFDAPSGTPVLTLSRSNCLSVKRSPVPGMEVPLHQLSVNSIQTWKSNFTSPSGQFRNYFQAENWIGKFTRKDASILLKHKAARSLHMDMRIGPFNDGEFRLLFDRFMALFGVDRSLFTVTVPLSAQTMAVDLGDVLKLQWPRFNLADGRLLRVVSVRYALRERQIEFALWG